MIDKNKIASENLSNNSVDLASNNFSNNSFVNLSGVFKDFDKIIELLFPSIRYARVERYRAETFYKIGMQTEDIIHKLGIKVKPIPPKAALPLFDKASIEHEENMYDIWAKLLAAASDNYNPIHIQYAEILSKIGYKEATILYDTYKEQKIFTGIGFYEICEKAKNNYKIDKHLSILINNANNPKNLIFPEIEYDQPISLQNLRYPHTIIGEDETFTQKFHTGLDPRYGSSVGKKSPTPDDFKKSEGIILSLNLLKQLDLINFHFDVVFKKSEKDINVYYPQWGVVLTEFGYKLVDSLQKYDIEGK